MNYNAKEVGRRIRALRKQRNLEWLSVAIDLNLSGSGYRKIESGERGLSVELLLSIAEYFDVSTDYLLKGDTTSSVQQELSYIINRLNDIKCKL